MVQNRFLILMALGSILFSCVAWAKDECVAELESEKNVEAIFAEFDQQMRAARDLIQQMNEIPWDFRKKHGPDDALLMMIGEVGNEVETLLSRWNPDEMVSNKETWKNLGRYSAKLHKFRDSVRLWEDRYYVHTRQGFPGVRGERRLVLPNWIYEVATDRGEQIKVRFSQQVVDELFWAEGKSVNGVAADHILEAVARGHQALNAKLSNGIATIRSGVIGEVIYAIKVTGGKGVGAVRVYGLAENGILGFVTVETEGDHDATYMRRVYERALRAHRAERWSIR